MQRPCRHEMRRRDNAYRACSLTVAADPIQPHTSTMSRRARCFGVVNEFARETHVIAAARLLND